MLSTQLSLQGMLKLGSSLLYIILIRFKVIHYLIQQELSAMTFLNLSWVIIGNFNDVIDLSEQKRVLITITLIQFICFPILLLIIIFQKWVLSVRTTLGVTIKLDQPEDGQGWIKDWLTQSGPLTLILTTTSIFLILFLTMPPFSCLLFNEVFSKILFSV